MTDDQKPPTHSDHLAGHVAERIQGIRLDSWRDQVALLRRQVDQLHTDCWPNRTKLRLLRSGLRAMERMYLRIERDEQVGRWTARRQRWHGARFGLWSILVAVIGRLLPKCWCAGKEGSDERV